MKRSTPASDRKEKGRERDFPRSNDDGLFIIIPIEVIHLIVAHKRFFLGIVEKHVLRFVSKEFHRLAHMCGVIQYECFWHETLDYILISFDVAKGGHLFILQWMKMCFLTEQFSINDESTCEGAALGGHLEVLKRYAQR
jgi:hypothetical protein